MTRGVLLLSVSLAVLGGAQIARAQDLRDLQARNAAAHALEDARRDLLSSQIETSSANERAATEMRLRGLETQRPGPSLRSLSVPPARPIEPPGRREAELSASASRLERLTQDALAESNARMRAIRPASQRKD
jgi:hypothetical protein